MAQRVWIIEFAVLAQTGSAERAQIGTLPFVAKQQVDVTAGAQTSAAFNASTNYIRIYGEVQVAVRGDGVTATTTDLPVAAFSGEYFGVKPGATISVIAAP